MKWKWALAVLGILLLGSVLLFKAVTGVPAAPAHQAFINGEVITMDESNRVLQALSVREGMIEAVGSTEEIMALVTGETQLVDLAGRTLMPGFIDAHGHFPGAGATALAADLFSPPLGPIKNIPELLEALRQQLKNPAPGDWVQGLGYDDTLLAEKRHPTRAELDQVSLDQPVVASHISGHMVVANSRALELVGIDANTENPVGGVIARRPGSNEPNGLLEETARLGIVAKLQDMGVVDIYTLVTAAVEQYASAGVTTAQAGGIPPSLLSGNALFSQLGIVPFRLAMLPFEHDFSEELLNGDYDPADYSTDRVDLFGVKLVADGSIQGYTGYLSEPYHTAYQGDAQYRGYPAIPREDLFEKVEALHRAGYQLSIHTNGDAAIEDALDAFEAAQAVFPVDDPRMILIHAQMARKDQIARMKDLGVTPSFFSAHTYYWGDRHRDIFMGPERAANMSPAKWAQDYGVKFTSHMDTPVTPMLPLQAVWSMVHRQSYGGEVLGPDQRIGVMAALRAVTIDAAWQIRQEGNRGSLEPGKHADLVILSGSPLDDPQAMRELEVERTLVAGATIYEK
jgi:predicted amidohydrolase YtcJ